jgi:hypothetical protein
VEVLRKKERQGETQETIKFFFMVSWVSPTLFAQP